MKLLFVFIMFASPLAAAYYECQTEEDYPGDGLVDIRETRKTIYLDGHLWHPIMLEHSQDCHCMN